MQRQHVAAGRELEERRRQAHAHVALAFAEPHRGALLGGQRVVASVEAPAPQDHRHVEGARPANHLAGDGAGAGDADRLAGQPARLGVELLVPGAGAQVGDVVGDAAIDGEQQREGQLGDRDRVLAGTVRDVDAARRGGLDVDGVVAGAGADDQRQAPGVEHRLGDLGGADDQHRGARRADRVDQRGVLEVGLIQDVAAGGLQGRQPAFLERISHEHAHGGLQPGPAGPGERPWYIDRARRQRRARIVLDQMS